MTNGSHSMTWKAPDATIARGRHSGGSLGPAAPSNWPDHRRHGPAVGCAHQSWRGGGVL